MRINVRTIEIQFPRVGVFEIQMAGQCVHQSRSNAQQILVERVLKDEADVRPDPGMIGDEGDIQAGLRVKQSVQQADALHYRLNVFVGQQIYRHDCEFTV